MSARAAGTLLLLGLLALAASPARAVDQWYDHYFEGQDLFKQGRYQDALEQFQQAIKLKPNSELNARPYGMEFVQYLPYYYQGVCYLRLADYNSAQRLFNIEEDKGMIRRSDLYAELRRLRTEAENLERQRVAREANEAATRFFREAQELHGARNFAEARARLNQAALAAQGVNPTLMRDVVELRDRIVAEEQAVADAAERARRIEAELDEGIRLLEGGRATDAVVRFDQVLALDPGNRRAAAGRREAQERILASKNRVALESAFQQGKASFDAGRYEEALRPLTDAAADPRNESARELLKRTQGILEGMRQQRERRRRVEVLLGEAEALVTARRFADALVTLQNLLALDAEHARARELLGLAEMMAGEALFARWLPNRTPSLLISEPRSAEATIESPSLAIVGVAIDDQRIARIEFQSGGQTVGEILPSPRLESGEPTTWLRFERVIPLAPGVNEIAVVVTDSRGLQRHETLHITRELRFYETRAFLPSAFGTAAGLLGLGLGAQHLRRRRAVRRRFNPYIAGAPVMSDDLFFGRDKLMARIMNMLHHNSVMITGERRIGKTTFLYHLKKELEGDQAGEYRFFPVFIDLQGVTEADFFHSVMSDVVEALQPSQATWEELRFRPDDAGYGGRHFSHDLQCLVDELKARTELRVKLALLIDEVDVLNEFSERVNQQLRSIFMKTFSENLVAIMSGVAVRRSWKSEGSPWYNFFSEIELQAFTREDAEALIRSPVEGIFRYQAEAVDAIVNLSDLKPYLIQKYCIYVVNRIIEQGRTTVRAEDVDAVRAAVTFESREPSLVAQHAPA